MDEVCKAVSESLVTSGGKVFDLSAYGVKPKAEQAIYDELKQTATKITGAERKLLELREQNQNNLRTLETLRTRRG